jgi:hypothetical protein
MTFPTQLSETPATGNPTRTNEAFDTLNAFAVYLKRHAATSGLTWAYWGGQWGAFTVVDGTLTLTNAATNYVVVSRATGVISVSTITTNWDDTNNYARVYRLTTAGSVVTLVEPRYTGPGGVHGPATTVAVQALAIACSDETTALTTGAAKVTFRTPFAFTLTGIRASVTTAPTGADLIVDVNEDTGGGPTSIMTTNKLRIDATEKTTTTSATLPTLTDTALADDAEITVDIDQVGSTVAGAGLKVYLIGRPT